MSCDNALILTALKTRLEKITTINNYPLTVKNVEFNKGVLTIDLPANKLPYIEIINGDGKPLEMKVGGMIRGEINITLRIVKLKGCTDLEMCDFESAVVRNLFGDSYDPSASNSSACRLNDGTRDLNTLMEYNGTFTDINLINSNRIWDVNFSIIYNRKITSF